MKPRKALDWTLAVIWGAICLYTIIDRQPVEWYQYAVASGLLVIVNLADAIRDM